MRLYVTLARRECSVVPVGGDLVGSNPEARASDKDGGSVDGLGRAEVPDRGNSSGCRDRK